MTDATASTWATDDAQRDGSVADALSRADDLQARARRENAALQATIADLDALRVEIERHRSQHQGRAQPRRLR